MAAKAATNQIERKGVNAVEGIFLGMGWIFREQPISDFGIDAHVEITDQGAPAGKLLALQIKTGKSYFKKRGDDWIYYGENRHLKYWTRHALPVFIVLHNPDTGLTVWQKIEERLITEGKDGAWSITIPQKNVLNTDAARFLSKGISSDPYALRKLRLALDLNDIKNVAKADETTEIFIKVDEWINKGLNFRQTSLHYGDPDGKAEMEWSLYAPMNGIEEFMSRLFPWLKYYYYRPIVEVMGEVHVHVLKVELNNIGKATLALEEFYESGAEEQNEGETDPEGIRFIDDEDDDDFYYYEDDD